METKRTCGKMSSEGFRVRQLEVFLEEQSAYQLFVIHPI